MVKRFNRNNVFRTTKIQKILYSLDELEDKIYISELARNTNTTFFYLSRIITELDRRKLIYKIKDGRKVFISLTPKGKEITSLIHKYIDLVGWI